MDKKTTNAFSEAKKKAEKILKDTEATAKLVDSAKEKAEKNIGFAKKLRDDLFGLFRMVKCWSKGQYAVPWKVLITAVAAILYFLNPLDLIPDFIIGTGLLDDASVIAFALNIIRKDVDEFKKWENSASASQPQENS
jgi:uncharacterized membrane protein YkvA (DUF1232 family)